MFKAANVGTVDRAIRIVAGVLLIALPFATQWSMWAEPMTRYGALAVGTVLVLTALVRFCPLYRLIGASTCPRSG